MSGGVKLSEQVALAYRRERSEEMIFHEAVRELLQLPAHADNATVLVRLSAVCHAAELWRRRSSGDAYS